MPLFDIFKSKNTKKELSRNEEKFTDTFILALVHRLRTPLNGARWALDSVIKTEGKEDNKKILNGGYDKIIDAINIVNKILKISEININEDLDLRKEKVNLCNIIDDILKNLGYLAEKNKITLEYDNRCDPVTILGDKEVLDIGLTNLIDNAFKYSPKGRVSVLLSREGSMAKLVIKDSGIGINREDIKHLFEKFYRGKNAQMVDPNETGGIGLFFTKKIIEMHGGNMSIDSEENVGTTVEVRLPID